MQSRVSPNKLMKPSNHSGPLFTPASDLARHQIKPRSYENGHKGLNFYFGHARRSGAGRGRARAREIDL